MIKKYLTVRFGVAALCAMLLSLCVVLGVLFAAPRTAFAEDDQPAQTEESGSGEVLENDWVTYPSIVNWKWKNFDADINFITAEALYDNANMYFKIYSLIEESEGPTTDNNIEWVTFTQSIEINGKDDSNAFRLVNGKIPAYVATTLNSLNVGTYYLVSSIPEAADGSYKQLGATTPFNILGINNSITKLTINQWMWSEFDYSKNTINLEVAHGWGYDGNNNVVYDSDTYETIRNTTFTVYHDNNGVRSTEAVGLAKFKIDGYGRVVGYQTQDETVENITIRNAFSNLNAGDYWLVAQTNDECDNFSNAQMQVKFSVLKHPNNWTATPSVLQWTWGDYNPKTNLISGAAKYNESATVYYGIFKKSTCLTADALVQKFELDKDGYVPENVSDILKNLDAGTYYLKGWTEDNSVNYDNCESVSPFTVQKAQNSWTVSPYVVAWQYGDFNKAFNVIRGEAKFDAVTQFSIYTDETCETPVIFGEDNTVFSVDGEGNLPEEVAQKLSALNKGTYYLLAVVKGTDNYYGINDGEDREPVPFEITALTNYWVQAPGLISWSEGHFSAFDIDENLSGEARLGNIVYTITDEQNRTLYIIRTENGAISSVQKGNGEAAKISDLNSLSVGAYNLIAEVEGSENYSSLTCTATFAVLEDSVGLTGIIAAVITFAILDIGAAGACIALIIIRRRKVEEQFRNMIRKELNRR